MASAETNGNGETPKTPIPSWLTKELFVDLLKKIVPGYKSTKELKAYPAMGVGENYATLMLRVEVVVEIEDGKTKTMPFMMKIPHDSEMYRQMAKIMNIFENEANMYRDIVPDFEQLYRDAGVEVKFGAEFYRLETTEHENILLEDLRPRGFKNANRLEGLDLDHTKAVLKKMAQWHAVSAVRYEAKGKYCDKFEKSMQSEGGRKMMEQMNEGLFSVFMECLPSYQGNELYRETIEKSIPRMSDIFIRLGTTDPNEFNVLNHGDSWTNNIMFQYDAFGKIKETYYVDLQMSRYGSPAADLLYFLISSPKLEIKLKQFEYLIKFYHDNLVENLKVLKYTKKIPSLKDIHIQLYKYGSWGFMTACGVMGAVLLDPTEGATFEAFLGKDEGSQNFKTLMYTNDRYRKHIEAILPWLYNRGALEA